MPLSCGAHHSQQAVYSRSVALARREYDVRRTCTHAPYTYRTPSSRAGPLSVPKHARTHVPPLAPLTMVAHVSDPDRRLTGLYETRFGSTSTCLSRARQRYHPRVSQQPSWCPGFESRVQNHVRPPHVTATLCPDRGAAEPSCTPLTCAACSPSTRTSHAAPTQPGRYQFPSPSTRVPIRRPVGPSRAGAHISGPGWRLPGCEENFFGAISTCETVSSQRCHARVRLLPCVVASCCLLWCLGVWPVRGRW